MGLATRLRLLLLGNLDSQTQPLLQQLADVVEIASGGQVRSTESADLLVFVGDAARYSTALQLTAAGLLDCLPDGLVLLDDQQQIVWHNRPFLTITGGTASCTGRPLHESLGSSELSAGDVRPLTMASQDADPVRLTVRVESRKWLGCRAVPCRLSADDPVLPGFRGVAITVRDVTSEVLERQKLEAIYRAGLELGNLTPDEVTGMANEERVGLLKENILHFTQEILGYETFEIRLLNQETQELLPLLEFGMNPEAASRQLFARPTDNGVTGYVAHSGSSYLCNDTQLDPLYLCGAADARSSLTVPLMLRDTVLGTFNVESPGTLSFDRQDLEFLELFGRVVANALNQLQLLVAEKFTTTTQNSERMRREISQPTDEILRDATWILERYIGHDPDVCDRLHQIVSATRRISGQVDSVSQVDAPSPGLTGGGITRPPRPLLRGKRILVVDGDAVARDDAHSLLGQMGCHVEGVPTCEDACLMVRSHHYDVVLTDIRLPDTNGYECFRKLRAINSHVPIIMMTGFGYDPTHSIVNARKEGLKAVLYKPFRRGQLLDEVEKAVITPPPV